MLCFGGKEMVLLLYKPCGGERQRCGCGQHPVTQCVGRGQDGAHSILPFLSQLPAVDVFPLPARLLRARRGPFRAKDIGAVTCV